MEWHKLQRILRRVPPEEYGTCCRIKRNNVEAWANSIETGSVKIRIRVLDFTDIRVAQSVYWTSVAML
jgi:hypothetical protein